ncbi:MAG: protein-L-isoaspartate(D-aspartate) O-methyltransferase [Gemmatimonadota bacterium]|nr:MAG: protein-L-isoaspartate(D-aspartate) O-methyltransferase [Gemmatimonadota bacterium]
MRRRIAAIVSLALLPPLVGVVGALKRQDSQAERYENERLAMVRQIEQYGVRDSATLAAMRSVPRHDFVPREQRRRAYGDHPLPIGYGQTISQPYIVAYMTEILEPEPAMKILEVGTGSGYQAAVLADIGCAVYTIEIFEALADSARLRLRRLGYDNVLVRHADGHYGWEEAAPFDAVIVTAAAGFIPPALVDQLKPGGRMVIPVGSVYGVQNLIFLEKDTSGDVRTRNLLPVRFVPMLKGLR